jgi:farnesyl-diphosphate farnesyltransferase
LFPGRREQQEFVMPQSTPLVEQLSADDLDYLRVDQGASTFADAEYQQRILPDVSRTFALTIPQLPERLRSSVTTAYLLCRIADTIEDEPTLGADEKLSLLEQFSASVAARAPAGPLGIEAAARLSEHTLPAERDLVRNLDRIVRLTTMLADHERAAIEKCIHIMCNGMHHYQEHASLRGLARMTDLDHYCYCVAGCVGEMLTDLFHAHCSQFAGDDPRIRKLAVSFGQGLQMTNILKDIWEDRQRGMCWLPREIFDRYKLELEDLPRNHQTAEFAQAMSDLVGVTHAHLRNGFEFTLAIPSLETGIRKFCFIALSLALFTLRKIHRNPAFTAGSQVKVARTVVVTTKVLTDLTVQRDRILQTLFDSAAYGLPLKADT